VGIPQRNAGTPRSAVMRTALVRRCSVDPDSITITVIISDSDDKWVRSSECDEVERLKWRRDDPG
jgi:hypothetical protein